MQRKDIITVVIIGLVAGFISMAVSNAIFKGDAKKVSAPVVEKIDRTFPDTVNDSTYNSFLNTQALDPTQPVQIGNNQNTAPFTQ